MTERSSSSTYSKCCGNLQAGQHSSFTKLVQVGNPLKYIYSLFMSLMLSFLLCVVSALILSFVYSLFLFLKCLLASHHTLFYYSHLFGSDFVTIVIWLVSEYPLFMILRFVITQTLFGSKFYVLTNSFPNSIVMYIIIYVFWNSETVW
jgi:hypothetical protein